ncbi:alcohol dehydrogenase [Hoeflea marina]|uniref:Alcohol dehydrogenase n=1 Tax=Hoeflea marina TaxID=274592 RepID=A0A317PJ32_9HYPH|nr:alcohol dehydrogenase family protein [Hoeflea marina]PWV99989.1 alcohol dehydrogenase [Hoeflea marina]
MSLPRLMSAVVLTAHGGPEVLHWRDDVPVPLPRDGEVLVEVLAAGVNNTDINTRLGWYAKTATGGTEEGDVHDEGGFAGALEFPRIQGAEFCGRIVAIGSGVTGWSLGRRVICPTNQPEPTDTAPTAYVALGSDYDGAFAWYCRVPARHLYDVTESPLSDVEIAALPCAFGTAENLLSRSDVRQGDRVLVTGASGGVGLAAVQLAKLRGALVTGQCAAPKAEAVRAAGAGIILDRGATPEPHSADVVIDVVGGAKWGTLIGALRPAGRYAVSGAIAGPIVEADLRMLYLNDLTLFGCTFQPPEVFQRLVRLINQGLVRPLVSAIYPLRDIARAQVDFLSKQHPGKLVLVPAEPRA